MKAKDDPIVNFSLYQLIAVDDDETTLKAIERTLPESWNLKMSSSSHNISVDSHQRLHAALIDIHLSGTLEKTEGIDLIRKLHKAYPHLEIIAMSGDLNRELMERCLKAGASRFLAKPLHPEELIWTLEKIEAYFAIYETSQRSYAHSFEWIGKSPESLKVKKFVASLYGESGPILIEGETGTGKEVVAQLLHQQNPGAPFIAMNVSAISENLFESELFGHVKGAFTGAEQNKMGLAEAANNGTLFLDEIEALPLHLQVKLLRFLESGEIKRVGSRETLRIHTRIIAASNENLEQKVREKKFREDLLWRLKGKHIQLPPLRERGQDVLEIAKFFLSQEKIRSKALGEDAKEALLNYSWPGNVRELKRVCEQILFSTPLPIVRGEDIYKILHPSSSTSSSQKIDLTQGLANLTMAFETQIIHQALEQVNDIDETAKLLGISRSSLYKKIKDYNISWRST